MIHPLEPRLLLADMTITGTAGNDNIAIKQTAGNNTAGTIEVSNSGSASITVKVGTATSTIAKGTKKAFASINKLPLVDLGKGDDKFTADASVKIPISLSGGDGKDTITGGSSNDVLSGDKATGTGFNDSVNGGAGNDTLYGYAGNDQLLGNDGADSIRAGTGKDTITGNAGKDKMFGESDGDLFFNQDNEADMVDGGSGTDSAQPKSPDGDTLTAVEANAAAAGVDNPNGITFTFLGSDGPDNIKATVDSAGKLTVISNGITYTYTRQQRTDILNKARPGSGGNANRILIRAGKGNDTVSADGGIEVVFGDEGNDQISGVRALAGGAGSDQLTAGSEGTFLLGGHYNTYDIPQPGIDGNDTITGSPQGDSINGGIGSDLIRPGTSETFNADDIGFDDDDTGRDTIDLSARSDALQITIDEFGNIDIMSDNGNAFVFYETSLPPTIISGKGFDVINGSSLNDVIFGNGGNDLINGNGGNDSLKGDTGNDTLNGGAANDTLEGGDGADVITGDEGADRITGGIGNDVLVGKAGNDTIFGDDGFDNLFGGADNDELHGGKDNDNLVGDIGNDKLFGDDANDKLDLGQGTDSAEGGAGNDTFINQDGAKDTVKGGLGTDTASKAVADGDVISEVETLT